MYPACIANDEIVIDDLLGEEIYAANNIFLWYFIRSDFSKTVLKHDDYK